VWPGLRGLLLSKCPEALGHLCRPGEGKCIACGQQVERASRAPRPIKQWDEFEDQLDCVTLEPIDPLERFCRS